MVVIAVGFHFAQDLPHGKEKGGIRLFLTSVVGRGGGVECPLFVNAFVHDATAREIASGLPYAAVGELRCLCVAITSRGA